MTRAVKCDVCGAYSSELDAGQIAIRDYPWADPFNYPKDLTVKQWDVCSSCKRDRNILVLTFPNQVGRVLDTVWKSLHDVPAKVE